MDRSAPSSRCRDSDRIPAAGLILFGLLLAPAAGAGAGDLPGNSFPPAGLTGAAFDAAPAGLPAGWMEHVVGVELNGVSLAGAMIVITDAEGRIHVSRPDLVSLGLDPSPAADWRKLDGQHYLALDMLPGAEASLDRRRQVLSMTLPATAFPGADRALLEDSRVDPDPVAPGLFLDYDLHAQWGTAGSAQGGFLELGGFRDEGFLSHSLVATNGEEGFGVKRLETAWIRDFPERMTTLRVGDTIGTPGAWGRAMRFAGIQYGTNFATNPRLVTTPLLAVAGEAQVPSTVDVLVDGRLVGREDVPAGPFEIDAVPTVTGHGEVTLIVRDLLGRQQVLTQPYYSGRNLLRPGLVDFAVELGAIREDYGIESNRYGDLLGTAALRYGVREDLTVELRGSSQISGATAAGVDVAKGLDGGGVLGLTMAAGGDDEARGWLAGIGYEWLGRDSSIRVQARARSESFSQPGENPLFPEPLSSVLVGGGLTVANRGALGVAAGWQRFENQPSARTITASWSCRIADHGYLGFSVSHVAADESSYSAFLTWTMSLGARRTLALDTQGASGRGLRGSLRLARNLPVGSGNGWRARIEGNGDIEGGVFAQRHAGRYGIETARAGGRSAWRASAVGSVLWLDGSLHASRGLNGSFALVEVPETPGITVYLENQPVAVTDAHGHALVPRLRPFETNRLSIDPVELPLDAEIDARRLDIVPARRTAHVATFAVRRRTSALLVLTTPGGVPLPAGTIVEVAGERLPLGFDGVLYVPDYVPGARLRVTVDARSRCTATLPPLPGNARHEPLVDAGSLACELP